jgi:hypothetical protein
VFSIKQFVCALFIGVLLLGDMSIGQVITPAPASPTFVPASKVPAAAHRRHHKKKKHHKKRHHHRHHHKKRHHHRHHHRTAKSLLGPPQLFNSADANNVRITHNVRVA